MGRNIILGIDDHFATYQLVTLISLFENNPGTWNVYLPVCGGLSDESVQRFRALTDHYQCNLIVKDLDQGMFKGFPIGCWVRESWIRHFAADILPESEERVLYLDGDTIVNGDISDFYNISDESKEWCYAACQDLGVGGESKETEYRNLGLDKNDIYFNGGVLIENLTKLRKIHSISEINQYVQEHYDQLKYPDQSTLNGLFRGKILPADADLYNCQINTSVYKDKRCAINNARIIHYSSSRPWGAGYRIRCAGDLWWHYARKLNLTMRVKYIFWRIAQIFTCDAYQLIYWSYCRARDCVKLVRGKQGGN